MFYQRYLLSFPFDCLFCSFDFKRRIKLRAFIVVRRHKGRCKGLDRDNNLFHAKMISLTPKPHLENMVIALFNIFRRTCYLSYYRISNQRTILFASVLSFRVLLLIPTPGRENLRSHAVCSNSVAPQICDCRLLTPRPPSRAFN